MYIKTITVVYDAADLCSSSTVDVTGVSLNPTSKTFTCPTGTQTIEATVSPSDATNKTVTWASSNTSVATVSSSGVVTPVAAGTCTITATATNGTTVTTDDKTATCSITVQDTKVTSITLNNSTLSLTCGGSTSTLTATASNSEACNKAVTWSSNATSVATVSTAGVVTPVGVGTATITATAKDGSGKTATCAVTVAAAGTCATPTFSVAAGTHTSVQSVTLACATSGATIRYTTNGTNPTATTGTVYSGAITVSSTQTIKAIAYKSCYNNSSVATAAYTINLPQYTVKWYVGDNSGTPASPGKQETVTQGNTSTPPTVSDGALGGTCSTKVFKGWTETWIGSTGTNTVPTDLNLWTTPPTITSDRTFYAVFATETTTPGSEEEVSNELTFSGTNGEVYTSYTVTTGVTISATKGGTNDPKFYTSDNTWRFYSGGTCTVTSTVGNITKIEFTASAIYLGNPDSGTYSNKVWTGDASSVTFSNTGTTKLTKVKVTYKTGTPSTTTYSDYITSCAAPTCTAVPTVETGSYSGLSATGVTLTNTGGITSLGTGTCSITSYGWVYGTSADPAIGGTGVTQIEKGTSYTTVNTSFGNSTAITGLVPGTTYHVRTYATNGAGTGYGDDYTFTTTAYTVTLNAGSGTVTGSPLSTVNGTVTLTSATPTSACSGSPFNWTFAGWSTDSIAANTTTEPTLIASGSYTPTGNTTLYAVYTQTLSGGTTTVSDVLTKTMTGATGTSYVSWSDKPADTSNSDAIYAGNTAGGNSCIQLRSKNSDTGIITTTSGGKATKVTLAWYTGGTTNNNRTVDIYGKNTAYTAVTDIYEASTQGTKIGSLTFTSSSDYETELTINGDYEYIALRSYDGALYLTSITIDWQTGSSTTYWQTAPVCELIDVTGVTLNKNTLTVECGDEDDTLEATVAPATATDKTVTWSSSDATVATVDANGVVTAVAPGTATITATATNGTAATTDDFSATCTVTVPSYTITLHLGAGTMDGCTTVNGVHFKTLTGSPCAEVTLPNATPSAACSALGWSFAGWATDSIAAGTTTSVTTISKITPTANTNLYAVYTSVVDDGGGTAEYTKVTSTDDITNDQYLIVYETNGIAFDGSLSSLDASGNYISVTISDSKITATSATEAAEFTITATVSGGVTTGTIKSASGNFIGRTSSSNGMDVSSSTAYEHELSISSGNFVAESAGGPDLEYNTSGTRFRYYSGTQAAIQLYKKGGGGTTYYESDPNCSGEASVTYDANGATSGTAPVDSNNPYSVGDEVTVLGKGDLVKTGYAFGGWRMHNASSGALKQPGATFNIATNTTLYAQWVEQYTVTLIDNGQTTTAEVNSGSTYTLPATGTSTCPDITFLGWHLGEYTDHLTGASSNPGVVASNEITVTANVTYVAVYQATAGGTGSAGSYELDYDTDVADLTLGYGNPVDVTATDGSEWVVKAYKSNGMQINKSQNASIKVPDCPNNITSIVITCATTKQISFSETDYTGSNSPTSRRTVTPSNGTATLNIPAGYSTGYIYTTNGANQITNIVVNYGAGTAIWTSKPTCCTKPDTPLTLVADNATLVYNGTVNLTVTGGNGQDITWSCVDDLDADKNNLLKNKTNEGATLQLGNHTAAVGTRVYTVTITQADKEEDETTICGATKTVQITCKARYNITFKVGTSTYSSLTNLVDGEEYTLPDISEDYNCDEGYAFAGWALDNADATAVDKAPESTDIANATKTWYAVWSVADHTETVSRTKYTLVTSESELVASRYFVIANGAKGKGLAMMDAESTYGPQGNVTLSADGSYLTFEASENIMELKLEGSATEWLLQAQTTATNKYLYNVAKGDLELYPKDEASKWTISIEAETNNAIIVETDYSSYQLQYNASAYRFACYTSTQQPLQLYRRNGTVSVEIQSGVTYTTTKPSLCTNDPVIRMNGGQWITSSKDQTVKTVIEGSMKNFSYASTLAVTSSNDHFTASVEKTTTGNNPKLALTVEYTPVAANITETADITITATYTKSGTNYDVTKTIQVYGRSLPDEFVVISQKNGKWYAVPANMSSEGLHDGIVVVPNAELTLVPVAPSTTIYTMRAVDAADYATNGNLVRLAGNGNKCLWATTETGQSGIRNLSTLAASADAHYEWSLATTDGTDYKITLPANAETVSGRQLANNNLNQYGYLKSECTFLILPVGCSSKPTNVDVSAKRVDATFSWNSNASEMVINIYEKSAPTVLVKTATVTESPATVTGLSELTEYVFTLVPDGSADCSVSGEFTTTGPTIDIVEWMEEAIIIQVDKDEALHPKVLFAGEEEHGVDHIASELFFSKYFEGEGSMKLLAVYNGTPNDISLEGYEIRERGCNSSNAVKSDADNPRYDLSVLGSIKAGQEIILFSRPLASETGVYACSGTFLDGVAAKSGVGENPRWIQCETGNEWGFPKMQFSGNDAMLLMKDGAILDVFGALTDAAGEPVSPPEEKNCRNEYSWLGTVKNMDYGKTGADFSDYTGTTDAEFEAFCAANSIDVSNEYLDMYTARCVLYRNNDVTSGEDAYGANYFDFVSLSDEWYGRSLCLNGPVTGGPTCHSYIELGEFDFDRYYRTYSEPTTIELDESVWKADQHLYKIDVPGLVKYSCLDMRLQLTPSDDTETVLTETHNQVPIIVPDDRLTNDTLFTHVVRSPEIIGSGTQYAASAERCKTCNVVVLSNATLTKAADNASNDVNEVYNIKVYPEGKLVVPTGTNYFAQSLAFRVQEDTISTADIKGTLKFKGTNHAAAEPLTKKAVFLDVRVNPENWHYITVPFNCAVNDITYSDGTALKLGTDYMLKWYDGAYRAENKTGGWTMVEAGDSLKKGLGYIVAFPGSGKVKHELRFPMSSLAIDDEKQAKNVGELYAYGAEQSEEDLHWNHRGWNMIGNPYMNYYNAEGDNAFTSVLVQGTLEHEINPETGRWTGEWVLNTGSGKDLRYVVAPQNNGWGQYVQRNIGNNLKPFTCYFVQIAGESSTTPQGINFTTAKVHNYPAAPAAMHAPAENNEPVWLGIKLTNDKGEYDETAVLISDKFTDDYDAQDDLLKMRGAYYKRYTAPVLATRNDYGEMAFNAAPDHTAETGIPVNFYAGKQGEYVFSLNNNYPLDGVEEAYLQDNVEGTWHNLLLGDYRFTTAKGDNTTRFILVVKVNRKAGQPTALEDGSLNGVRVFTEGNRICVNGMTDGSDVTVLYSDGKLVSRATKVNGGQFAFDAPASGVYTIRVSGTTNALVKCVVK